MKPQTSFWRYFLAHRQRIGYACVETLRRVTWRCYAAVLVFTLIAGGPSALAAEVKAKLDAKPVPKTVKVKTVSAAKEPEKRVKKTIEKQSGQVSSVSPKTLAVLYQTKGSEEFETVLKFNKDVTLKGYKKLSEVQLGDTVQMEYEKAVEDPGGAGEKTTLTLKSVALVKKVSKDIMQSKEVQ